MKLGFSIIIPVYNRPEELAELLQSILLQHNLPDIEIVVVEDGSDKTSELVVNQYADRLNIKYCVKKNTGPGDSRNYGMTHASGDYFIILDSDCLLPENYLSVVSKFLGRNYADAYGGPDVAHSSFNNKQKAINYSMTSFLTTGGLRGSKKTSGNFQVRSFNMGLSKKAFQLTGGFAKQRIGEDIDLNFRLKAKKLSTVYIADAFVYHKRRNSWPSFFKQVQNFGAARPILNQLHPGSARLTYWFPSVFIVGLVLALILCALNFPMLLWVYLAYFIAITVDSFSQNKQLLVAFWSVYAVLVQFLAYGTGFLRTIFRLYLLQKSPKEAFPEMFE